MEVLVAFGLDHSVSAGIVSSLVVLEVRDWRNFHCYASLIQVDAAINPW